LLHPLVSDIFSTHLPLNNFMVIGRSFPVNDSLESILFRERTFFIPKQFDATNSHINIDKMEEVGCGQTLISDTFA